MEFRAHNIPLADELELIIKTLNQSDNEALHTINAEIKKLMTPYVVEKFIKYQPFLMTEFLKDFDPKEAAQVLLKLLDSDSLENGDPLQSQRREAAIDYLRKTHEWPEEIWSHVPTILSHGDNTLKMGILTALSSKANWPKPVWGEIVNLLNTQNPELLNKVSFSLMQSTKWPEEVWAKIPALLMKPSSEPIMPQLIMGIERQGAWPESFWKHVPEIMESPIHNGPLNFLALLRNQDPWPQEVWAKIPAMMQKADTDVQQALATALRSKAIWPQSVWDELLHGNFEHMSREKVLGLMLKSGAFKELNSIPIEIWRALPKYLQSKEYDLRSAAFKFLNAQQAWPKEFWNEVPALLRNPLPPVQESMVFALEKQGNWPLRVRALVSQLAKKGDWSVMHASEHVLKAQPKMKPSLCLLFYLKLMK